MAPKTNACIDLVREGLVRIGYHPERVVDGIAGPGLASIKHGFVAFADQPFDARTSTLIAVDMAEVAEADLQNLQSIGAPVIAQCAPSHVLFWKQSPGQAKFIERVDRKNILSFFQKHSDQLAPGSIYRAKLWGRTETSLQLDLFVDSSLLPLVEHTAGETLKELLESSVRKTKSALGWKHDISPEDGIWLLKAVFWLIAAKILQDKGVRGFSSLDFRHIERVYDSLAKHYNRKDPRPVSIPNARRREALVSTALDIQSAPHCAAVTTESLAWVYESALIDKITRRKLGTHSTPTWLIDDIVAKLRPWIDEMPLDNRRVFEPACGHAGFLISAMRLLSEALPSDRARERKEYLRQRLHGIEYDSFAHEIARLSLTLADVPNDNGWMLENVDMFQGDILRSAVSRANIVLANPPFEKFGESRPDNAVYHNQADETFRHIVEALPVGGVFGVVLPQTFLDSTQAKPLRRLLLDEYDLSEITLFADKVFNYGESETAVIIGKRVGAKSKNKDLIYRRVREQQIETYKQTLVPSSVDIVDRSVFDTEPSSLLMPELMDVWQSLADHPTLGEFVDGGQGFQHRGQNDPLLARGAIRESLVEAKGLVPGFAGWHEDQLTHELPSVTWLNLDDSVIRRPLHGLVRGSPQVLVNYARVSRESWRIKALLDSKGHPVTSDFNVLRPTSKSLSLRVLWALLNSPVANAFAYAHSSKRHVLVGDLRALPIFPMDPERLAPLESAIAAYFKAAKGAPLPRSAKENDSQLSIDVIEDELNKRRAREEKLKYLHWRIDAEVLRLYNLPESSERKVLDLFTGVRRRGVPFIQDHYFPKGFTFLNRLGDLLAITADWTETNRRRCELIEKDVYKKLEGSEPEELKRLEWLADARDALMNVLHPRKPNAIELLVERLKQEGKWVE